MPDSKKTGSAKKTEGGFDPTTLVENAFLMGLGMIEVTREMVTDFTGELIERGKMSQSEAKKLADRISTSVEERQSAISKTVSEQTNKVLSASGVATKSELDALRAEIAELKKRVPAKKPAAKKPAARKATPKP